MLSSDRLRLGLVIPLQGSAGIFGPSCEACAQLAAEELNLDGGVLGREVRLVPVDGGLPAQRVADEVEALTAAGAIDAVTGWHISPVRQAISERVAGVLPYTYATMYEGGESSPGVFVTGETPYLQVSAALRWLTRNRAVRRWFVVGNDYVWPHETARVACGNIHAEGGQVCGTSFVPLGTEDFDTTVRQVERSGATGVLMLLVGHDAVVFNRAFTRAGLDQQCVRFSPLMEENMLMASGAASTRGLYAASGFFDGVRSTANSDFRRLYERRFGPSAPALNGQGEACYEAILLLAALLARADRPDVTGVSRVADSIGYDGPRGAVHLRDRHLQQRVHLAATDGLGFEVVASFAP